MGLEKKSLTISIITPSYNQGEFIEETIQSVLAQEGDFFIDYLIMDGGSKDQTVEVVKKYEQLLKENCEQEIIDKIPYYISRNKDFKWNRCNGISYRWVSEKDEGQADAINKGFKRMLGDVAGWLNSDDVYYPGALDKVSKNNFSKFDFVYGKGMWISKKGRDLLPYPTFEPSFYAFYYQCTLCQPTVFFSKKAISELGPLNNDYYCGFDFEYWMRVLSLNKKFGYINSYLARSRMYNENKSLANQEKVNNEISNFKKKYYAGLSMDKDKLDKFKSVDEEAFARVHKLNSKLKKGDKLNLMFDATVIANGLTKNEARSGIFFTAYNILSEMLKRKDLKIMLYCDESRKKELEKFISIHLKERSGKTIVTENDLNLSIGDSNENFLSDIKIFFSPIFKIPEAIRQRKDIIKFTVLYDTILLMFPEYFPQKQDWLLDMIAGINKDDYYFAISESTKKDFIKHVPKIDPDKITVTHLAASEDFYCCVDEKKKKDTIAKYKFPEDKKYIFSLCTLEPRKNLIRTVKGFVEFIKKNKIDDLVFLLGGSHWDEFMKTLKKEIDDLDDYKDKIIRLGYIDDEDLPFLYSNAEFFVYISLYEGFGLPVLEAMKCGVPVITSNNSSLPEVIGDSGIMIDAKSEKDLVKALEKLYFNGDLRKELSQKGLERSKIFSWKKTVDLMADEMDERAVELSFKINEIKKTDDGASGTDIANKIYRKIIFVIFSPNKFIKKYSGIIVHGKLRQPARKIWHAVRFKKLK